MKFISVIALAACAVLVSAAPHHGGNSGTSINTNDESNREVKITDKSNTEITDNSSTSIQHTDNSSKNIKGNIQNQEENRVNKGLLAGILSGDLLAGGVNILSSTTTNQNKVQNAQNNN
ncbi:hypothetical protein BD770DRAFT_391731 [Pilaira anomala]|nr:hypothetical protein BD770DRAFT_391731 [Pilaira anomala]